MQKVSFEEGSKLKDKYNMESFTETDALDQEQAQEVNNEM